MYNILSYMVLILYCVWFFDGLWTGSMLFDCSQIMLHYSNILEEGAKESNQKEP